MSILSSNWFFLVVIPNTKQNHINHSQYHNTVHLSIFLLVSGSFFQLFYSFFYLNWCIFYVIVNSINYCPLKWIEVMMDHSSEIWDWSLMKIWQIFFFNKCTGRCQKGPGHSFGELKIVVQIKKAENLVFIFQKFGIFLKLFTGTFNLANRLQSCFLYHF